MDPLKCVGSLMVGVWCSAVVGCSSGVSSAPPVGSPSPSVTLECVPEAGGDPVSCGPIEFEQAQRRDALYAEAEAVYRRFWGEMRRVELSSTPELTPELEAMTGDPYRETLVDLLARSRGSERVSGEPRIAWVRRLVGLSRSGSIVALETCSENADAMYADPEGGAPAEGFTVKRRLYFSRGEATLPLRIVDSEFLRVTTC